MRFLKSAMSAAIVGALFLAAPALRADSKQDDGHRHWDRFEMLKKKLDLSGDQVSEWKAAEKRNRESEKVLRDKVKADEAQLAVLVDQKASDDDLRASLDTLDKDHRALVENGQKFIERLRQILNPLQQAKAALMMDRMGHGRKGGFGGSCRPRGHWGGGPKDGMGQGGWNHAQDDGGSGPDGGAGD